MKLSTLFSVAALCCSAAHAEDTAKVPVFVIIHADIKKDDAAKGAELIQQYAGEARKDKASGMFEVLQENGRPNHFTLIEEWESQAAYDRHLSSDHTIEFRSRLQPMLGSPFDERLHSEV
jgi:quinol monooxygenase YgiN